MGSGCDSVGRAVASDTRGPRFESSHRQKIIFLYYTFVYRQLCIENTKIKKKRPGMAHFLKKLKKSTESVWRLDKVDQNMFVKASIYNDILKIGGV